MTVSAVNQLKEPYSEFIRKEALRWVAQIPTERRQEFRDVIRARAAIEGCASRELLRAVLEQLK